MLCKEIISQANLKYSSQYQGELASHLPMCLVALERLGAGIDRLCDFTNNYSKRLEPRAQALGLELDTTNWKKYLGQNRYHIEYLNYFKKQLNTLGIKETLEQHLPTLFTGVAGGAFHGLIRLGYGIDSNNDEEISEALSYWAISWLDLGANEIRLNSGTLSLVELLDRLHGEFGGTSFVAPNIARRMEIVSKLEPFRVSCSEINTKSAAYEEIAPVVLKMFHQSLHFTALHALTSTHAFRIVSPFCLEPRVAAFNLLIAIVAAYVTIEAPKINVNVISEMECDWEGLKKIAIESNDDHIPKIVYSCFEEYSQHKSILYFEAAHRYAVKNGG